MSLRSFLSLVAFFAFFGGVFGIVSLAKAHGKRAAALCPSGQRAVLVGSGRSDKNEILVAYECERAK